MEGSDWNLWFGCLVATIPYKRSQTIQPSVQIAPTSLNEGRDRWKPRATATWKYSEATMAALITIAIVVAVAGGLFGAYLKICLAIRRDDGRKGSLRRDAPSQSAQTARTLVGMNSSRWD
jgi:hypothetical protein